MEVISGLISRLMSSAVTMTCLHKKQRLADKLARLRHQLHDRNVVMCWQFDRSLHSSLRYVKSELANDVRYVSNGIRRNLCASFGQRWRAWGRNERVFFFFFHQLRLNMMRECEKEAIKRPRHHMFKPIKLSVKSNYSTAIDAHVWWEGHDRDLISCRMLRTATICIS